MTREEFIKWTKEKIIVLDGATGTQLIKTGMPKGVCPEKWVLQNPDSIIDMQKKYADAGSDIVYACTFGLNEDKLKEFGLDDELESLNEELVKLSKKAVGNKAYVAGDMSPSGKMLKPFGQRDIFSHINMYKKQAEALEKAGVDLFVIETMLDLQEARACIFAIKSVSNKPIMVSMTFEKNKRTLTGSTPEIVAMVLESMGVDAIGTNCSTGPEDMIEIVEKIRKNTRLPVISKPNAGIPKNVDGKTVFSMDHNEFETYVKPLVESGSSIIGGCCGTDECFVEKIKKKSSNFKPVINDVKKEKIITSLREYRKVDDINLVDVTLDTDDVYDVIDNVFDLESEDQIPLLNIDNFNVEEIINEVMAVSPKPLAIKTDNIKNMKDAIVAYSGILGIVLDKLSSEMQKVAIDMGSVIIYTGDR